MTEKQHYVYIYRLLDGTPVYVGKGSGSRFREHFKGGYKNRLFYKNRQLVKERGYCLYPEIIPCSSADSAFSLEMNLIEKYGRVDLKTGTLYNLTAGGEGARGVVISEETRFKRSESRKGSGTWCYGKTIPQETRDKISNSIKGEKHPNFGKKFSRETIEKIRAGNLGKKHSEESKLKMRANQKKGSESNKFGKPRTEEVKNKIRESRRARQVDILCPHCGKVGREESNMKRWHFDNCRYKEKGPEEPGLKGIT